MRLRGSLIAAWSLAFVIGCEDGRDEGDRCKDEPDVCSDGTALWTCSAGSWTYIECAIYCGSQQLVSDGCLVGDVRDACHCVDPDAGKPCTVEASPPTCVGTNTVKMCTEGELHNRSCSEVCSWQSLWTAGCFQDPETSAQGCVCIDVGDPCSIPGYPMCVGFDELLHCGNGRWRLDSCTNLCAPERAIVCGDDALGLSGCICHEAETSST